jgi:putative transposase
MNKVRFGVGTRFEANGTQYNVIAIRGGLLECRNGQGATELLAADDVMLAHDLRIDDRAYSPSMPQPLEGVPKAALQKARALEQHVLEVMTGFPQPESDDETQPAREQYDPSTTTLSQRIVQKALELKLNASTLWNLKRRYESRGLIGLVDARVLRVLTAFKRIDPRVKEAVLEMLDAEKTKSHKTKRVMRGNLERILKEKHNESVPLPSDATLNRYLSMVGKPLGVFSTSKQRKSMSNRPNRHFGTFQATRPGQVILKDATTLNVFALDPITMKWVQVQLSVAIDLYSRSLVAWRLTPTLSRVDASFLLFDILAPKSGSSDWHESTRSHYFGIPDEIWIAPKEANDLDSATDKGTPNQEVTRVAIPSVYPEEIVVDKGKVFVSEAFRQSCLVLGINLQYARTFAPTDKANVEAIFNYIKNNFCAHLPGFTGADISSRGVDVEDTAFFFISELEQRFAEWVATEWQQRSHRGLFLPPATKLELSPNDMYKEGLARAGFVYILPDPTIYYDLLPCEWRKVTDTGVSVDSLFYDHPRLYYYRDLASRYSGKYAGKYPVRVDQRNLEEVFFFDYLADTPQWIALRWRGARELDMPFNSQSLAAAKSLCLQRGLESKDPKNVETALRFLLDRWDQELTGSEKERKTLVRRALQTTASLKDRARIAPQFKAPDQEADWEIPDEQNIADLVDYEGTTQPIGDEHVSTFDF